MKKILTLCMAALLMLTLAITLAACGGDDTSGGATQLTAPTLTKEGGELKWTIVEHALSAADGGYTIKISKSGAANVFKTSGTDFSFNTGDGKVQTSIDGLAVPGAYTFSVCANGDGENYTDSNWSNTITHTITETLEAPILEFCYEDIGGGTQSYLRWTEIENAEHYELECNGSNDGEIDFELFEGYCYALCVELPTFNLYDEFCVRAVGDGTIYLTSGWSNMFIVEVV